MACFDPARYCSLGEYEASINKRLLPEEIVVEGQYQLMFATFEWVKRAEALTIPAVCVKKEMVAKASGLWVVRLFAIDEDFQPTGKMEFVVLRADGVTELTDEFRAEDPEIREGYFKNYDDGTSGEIDTLFASTGELVGS